MKQFDSSDFCCLWSCELMYQDLSHPCPVGADVGYTGHVLHADGTAKGE